MIRLIAGSGPGFGTGHVERMKLLAEFLARRGHLSELVHLSSPGYETNSHALSLESRLTVLDARDVDPEMFSGRVIALDNQSPSRKIWTGSPMDPSRIIFHDTIPHPDIPIDVTMQNCLVDPEKCQIIQDVPEVKRALIYAGSWTGEIPGIGILHSLGYSLTQIGGRAGDSHVTLHERLPTAAFRREMCRSSLVLTYFGMTAFQAMYLNKRVILFSIGGVHDDLSEYLASTGIRFLKNQPTASDFVDLEMPKIVPGGRGFDILVDLIEEHK
ncbi:MAG: hypothetical protein K8S54_17400 [Spirochaetia bacterium]|nr:hypothetical protein [Spirochaetia bacterium]